MRLRNIRKIQGFSLVEICIVCGVLAVLMIPVFAMMSKGSSVTIRNRNEILAQQHALNVINYCNITPYDDDFLAPTPDTGRPVSGDDLKINLANGITIDMGMHDEDFYKIASRTIAVKEFNAGDGWPNKYKIVTVKVEWQQIGEQKPRSVSMSGLLNGSL